MSAYVFKKKVYWPKKALSPYFKQYRSLEASGSFSRPLPFLILPDGSAHLIFHLYKYEEKGYSRFVPKLSIVGPRSVFKEINRQHRSLTLIFSFRPAGAFTFLPFPVKEISDIAIPLEKIWGSQVHQLNQTLTELSLNGETEGAIRFMEDYMFRQLEEGNVKYAHPVIQNCLSLLETTSRPHSIRDLAAHYGISERYLHQLFCKQVGFGPKRFFRIQRVNQALKLACEGWAYGWADLAITAGYYDQSHMIDEFQEMLGNSPSQVLDRFTK